MKELKSMLTDRNRVILVVTLFIIAFFMPIASSTKHILFLLLYLMIGWDVIYRAFNNISHGRLMDEHFLMTVATFGAIYLGLYEEALEVMLLYQIGELFQDYAVDRSRKSIQTLLSNQPDEAQVWIDGQVIAMDPEEVEVGSSIQILPGEKVPLDSVITEGESSFNESSITGESMPVDKKVGDPIFAGTVNHQHLITAQVTKEYDESTVMKMMELIEEAEEKKARTERFITQFAKYYTPTVVVLAVLIFMLPLLMGASDWKTWFFRALIFLVVSCPCALVISVPLAFFGGIGRGSKEGILFRGGQFIQRLTDVKQVLFDKTGTLTSGQFALEEIQPIDISQEEMLFLAAHLESTSTHPIGQSIVQAYAKPIDSNLITQVSTEAGFGIRGKVKDKEVLLGNEKMMQNHSIDYQKLDTPATMVHMAVDREYKGYFMVADQMKTGSNTLIARLKEKGIMSALLTGDQSGIADHMGKRMGIDQVYSQLLPEDKLSIVEKTIAQNDHKGSVVFVGDGINDAPVLSIADVGIGMGAMGSDIAIESSDVIIMDDDPMKVLRAIDISKQTMRIAWQNIIFTLATKIIILILAVFGRTNMQMAIFADVGVTCLVIINTMRLLTTSNKHKLVIRKEGA